MVCNQMNYAYRVLRRKPKTEEQQIKIIYKDGGERVVPAHLLSGIVHTQRKYIFTYCPVH